MLDQITALILTFNEAPNIERTLSRLKWAREIVVIDSFSTDETCDLVRKLPQARILQREFDSFAQQCNFGLQHIGTEWVLSLDADYLLCNRARTWPGIGWLSGTASPAGHCARRFIHRAWCSIAGSGRAIGMKGMVIGSRSRDSSGRCAR
jgi:glycosyltransferase involved in cell wall biosynthesis